MREIIDINFRHGIDVRIQVQDQADGGHGRHVFVAGHKHIRQISRCRACQQRAGGITPARIFKLHLNIRPLRLELIQANLPSMHIAFVEPVLETQFNHFHVRFCGGGFCRYGGDTRSQGNTRHGQG